MASLWVRRTRIKRVGEPDGRPESVHDAVGVDTRSGECVYLGAASTLTRSWRFSILRCVGRVLFTA